MRQCDLCYLLSTRPARAFPDCTSSAHRPCIDRTKRIREASTDRRTSDARYAWPTIRTTAERMRIADRVQSRPQQQPKNPYTPRTRNRQPTCDTLRRDAASSRPRLLTLETAGPHTDEHHSISSAAPPSRNSNPHTDARGKASSMHCPRKKQPAPHRRTPRHIAHSTAQPKQQPTHTATRNKASSTHCPRKKTSGPRTDERSKLPPPSSAPTQRKAATAPSPGPGKPQGAPAAVQPDRRGRKRSAPRRSRQAPSRTTSRHKRKSARTERSVCADLHRVQGYPCGDITSSCRRWSSWRPSEPKPSLRQPSGPSERQPSWVRPF